MSNSVMIALICIAVALSIVSVCVVFVFMERLEDLNGRVLENRASINRHTQRMRQDEENRMRMDHSINDLYGRYDEINSFVRRYLSEVNEANEGSDQG